MTLAVNGVFEQVAAPVTARRQFKSSQEKVSIERG
jgi:hypothetical protein